MGWCSESKYQRIWRPVSIADANRYSVSWSRRNDARDRLDDLTFQYQKIAAESALSRNVLDSELKSRPQRGPLHTSYPSFPAARACLGLSAVSEFKAHAGKINTLLQSVVKLGPERIKGLDQNAIVQTSRFVAEAVANRLCIDQLYRIEGLGSVESYRLFAVATIDFRFTRLKEVILGACTLGDLIFGLVKSEQMRQRLHPLTCRILEALAPACKRYQVASVSCNDEELPTLGANLAKDLMEALVPFQPLQQTLKPGDIEPKAGRPQRGQNRIPIRKNKQITPDQDAASLPLAGTEDKVPPSIDEPGQWQLKPPAKKAKSSKITCEICGMQNPSHNKFCIVCGHQIEKDIKPSSSEDSDTKGTSQLEKDDDQTDERLSPPGRKSPEEAKALLMIQQAVRTIAQATARSQWDDPRVDQVAEALRNTLFLPGVIEEQLITQRHRIKAIGSEREGVIHEDVLSRCRDKQALSHLNQGAAPIEKKLRGFKWFGQRQKTLVDRLQDRGSLDPRRLYRISTSPLLHRRWRQRNVTDYKGWPFVVLAKDGSSSNTIHTTFAGKILVAAFLRIQKLAKIRLFAADYSSKSRAGYLVRWLYHPQKTPGRSSHLAVEAVASLPLKGEGGNEDVLSISYIMNEVLNFHRSNNQTVIVINITDGKFNSPIDEFRSMIKKLRADHKLTYSLVILGDTPVNVPEADHIVRVPSTELQDPHQIAERIAKHVNALVRNLRSKVRSRYG